MVLTFDPLLFSRFLVSICCHSLLAQPLARYPGSQHKSSKHARVIPVVSEAVFSATDTLFLPLPFALAGFETFVFDSLSFLSRVFRVLAIFKVTVKAERLWVSRQRGREVSFRYRPWPIGPISLIAPGARCTRSSQPFNFNNCIPYLYFAHL